MADVTLEAMHRGDKREIRLALTHEGAPWTPPVGAVLRCTGRRDLADTAALVTDADAQFTVSNTGDAPGITADGAEILVTLAPVATNSLAYDTDLYCDVQASGDDFGPWTVAAFVLPVRRDATRTP